MTEVSPHSGPVEAFDVVDNCLCVGGKKVSALAEEIGGTPFYAYDRRLIRQRIELLRDTLGTNARLHYAIKANPMPQVVDFIAPLVDGLDVASVAEMRLALAAGTSFERVSFAGPGKRVTELEAAVDAGITINVESPLELERISTICAGKGSRASIALRVNPDFELKSSGMKMSGGPKQFGIDAEQLPPILAGLSERPVDFAGFHIFSGSQNLDAHAIVEAQQKSLELALALAEHAPAAPRKINIGGGFGIPYFPGERPLDLAPIKSNLAELSRLLKRRVPEAQLIVELGRFMVGEAGVYITEIIDKKVSRGRTYLIADGGLHHHLSLSGNFGQVIRKNYPLVCATNVTGGDTELVSIVGPLCTPLDVLGDRMQLPAMEVGDLIAVFQSGAYGYTASPLKFLSHQEPQQILV